MATKFLAECLISSEDELELFTQKLAPHLSAPLIIGLNGPMGSGKTTFVRCIAAALGSTDWVNLQRMQSYNPTNHLNLNCFIWIYTELKMTKILTIWTFHHYSPIAT